MLWARRPIFRNMLFQKVEDWLENIGIKRAQMYHRYGQVKNCPDRFQYNFLFNCQDAFWTYFPDWYVSRPKLFVTVDCWSCDQSESTSYALIIFSSPEQSFKHFLKDSDEQVWNSSSRWNWSFQIHISLRLTFFVIIHSEAPCGCLKWFQDTY